MEFLNSNPVSAVEGPVVGPPHDACTLPVLLDNTMLASLSILAGSSVVSDTPAVGPGPLQGVIRYKSR